MSSTKALPPKLNRFRHTLSQSVASPAESDAVSKREIIIPSPVLLSRAPSVDAMFPAGETHHYHLLLNKNGKIWQMGKLIKSKADYYRRRIPLGELNTLFVVECTAGCR